MQDYTKPADELFRDLIRAIDAGDRIAARTIALELKIRAARARAGR